MSLEPAPADNWRKTATVALAGLFGLALLTTLWAAQVVFIPIVFALLVTYALQPLQRLLVRLRVPGALAAMLVIASTLGVLGAGAYGVRTQANAFFASLPDVARRLRAEMHDLRGSPNAVSRVEQAAQEIAKGTSDSPPASSSKPGVTRVQVEQPAFSFGDFLWRGTGGLVAIAGQALVVIVLVFYFLASGDLYRRKLLKVVGSTLSDKRMTVEILNDIEIHIERYLAVRFLISVIVGTATGLAFWWLGMPNPAMWGLAAGLLNVIPYVGPIAVAVTATIVGLLHFGALGQALLVGAAASAIGVIEGFGVTPVLMGKAGRMNGAAVFIVLTIWGFLWGLWGLLLAVPMTMAIKVICDHVEGLGRVSEILGE